MKTVHVFLAPGFEEIEALTIVDVLRRGGIDVQMVSITAEKKVTGAHGIAVVADGLLPDACLSQSEALILPGGMPGATNLAACEPLLAALRAHAEAGKQLAAICAAPLVLGRLRLLNGKRATCYPGFEEELTGATCTGAAVEQDGHLLTGRGPAAALAFSLALLGVLAGQEQADTVAKGMLATE